MNMNKMLMKRRPWASILAISLCLTGLVSCSKNQEAAAPSTDTANSSELEPSKNSDLESLYRTYEESIQTNVLKAFKEVAEFTANSAEPQDKSEGGQFEGGQSEGGQSKNEEGLTADFIRKLTFDPQKASSDLTTFLTIVDKNSDSETAEEREKIKIAAQAIQTQLLSPLKEKTNDSTDSSPQVFFTNLNSGKKLTEPYSRNPEQETIKIIQKNLGVSVGSEWEGVYGSSTYTKMSEFVSEKNEIIKDNLDEITRKRSIGGKNNWLPIISLALVLVDTAGLITFFYVFTRKEKKLKTLLESQGLEERNSPSDLYPMVMSEHSGTDSDLESLKLQVTQLSERVSTLENTPEGKVEGKAESKVSNGLDLGEIRDKARSQRDTWTPTGYSPEVAMPKMSAPATTPESSHLNDAYNPSPALGAYSSADIYNENPSAFQKKVVVALSKTSQEELRVGKGVTPTFSPLLQGDFWVVANDNTFYLVFKENMLINANNLETLQIIYSFSGQPNASPAKRRYKRLAEVKPHVGSTWILDRKGEVSFQA